MAVDKAGLHRCLHPSVCKMKQDTFVNCTQPQVATTENYW